MARTRRFRSTHENIFCFFKGDVPRRVNVEAVNVPAKYAGFSKESTIRQADGYLQRYRNKPIGETRNLGTVWRYHTSATEPGRDRRKFQHPATMPNLLTRDLIRVFSDRGDVVLDPMCGSGTTCIEAKKEGRGYIGIEVVPEYAQLARQLLNPPPIRRCAPVYQVRA